MVVFTITQYYIQYVSVNCVDYIYNNCISKNQCKLTLRLIQSNILQNVKVKPGKNTKL